MWLALLAAVAAALYFFLMAHGYDDSLVFVKPLPALLLAIELLRAGKPLARLMAVGLVFAGCGDAALQRTGDLPFLIGMVCFIVQHVVYIAAFVQAGRQVRATFSLTPMRIACLVFYIAALCTLLMLLPHAGMLLVPLMIYSAFLLSMAFCALLVVERPGGSLVAIGAVLFVASDVLLGMTRFYPGFALQGDTAQYAINATYYAAQIVLTLGFYRVNVTLPEAHPEPVTAR